MDIRLQQLNPTIGDIEGNAQLILTALQKAEAGDIDLLILPELCTCGYSPMDLLERPAFREAIYRLNQQIIDSTKETAIIFGSITPNKKKGRPLFNAAIMAQYGQKITEIYKTLLPTYDVFDEDRYFERNDKFDCVEWEGRRLGITICEDIWANTNAVQYHTYAQEPVQKVVDKGAEIIINLSASPFTDTKSETREQMLKKNAKEMQRPVLYANQVGGHTELISDGDSMALNEKAQVVARAPLFEEAFIDVEWDEANNLKAREQNSIADVPSRMGRIFYALRHGLHDYLKKTAVTNKVVVGLSGGIDSALLACIATEALGAENVTGVAMPSDFSSEGSVTDAEKLVDNLGIELHEIRIKSIYEEYMQALSPHFKNTEFDHTEENLQSRARGMVLMALANKFNWFVLNTGNKSELATGYCTLYGDMNGALAVISDLYKTEVFELAAWLNEFHYESEMIPCEILTKPPSAELRPNQKDTDRLPEYDKLDIILKLYIEDQKSPQAIISHGFEEEMVKKVIKLVNYNEYKRHQSPPGLKIHNKAFGSGRRWPLTQHWT